MEDNKEVKQPRFKKGFWKPEEDLILKKYVEAHGEGNWTVVSKKLGLQRGGKSCRLRWKNYLRPNIKRGIMSQDEKDLIIRLHKLLGNRWSLIAGRLPGRTDNEVKNYWNTHLNKKASTDQITLLHEDKRQLSQENLEVSTEEAGEIDTVVDSWMDNLKTVKDDYGMNMPPAEYSPFFNYEAFMPLFDNLVWLDPFGSSSDEIMREAI